MKQTVKTLLAVLIAILGTTAEMSAQNRTYTGSYPLYDIIGEYGDGTATYAYIDDYDRGRIYDGAFTLKWNGGRGRLSGRYDHDKQDGPWTYSTKNYDESITLDFQFSNGTLNGPCSFAIKVYDGRWVLKMNFKNGKIDGPFSINHFNLNNQTNAFIKGNIVENYPVDGWEYKPHIKNGIETTFRFLGNDPNSPDKLEIRKFDTRTGSVEKELLRIERDNSYSLYNGIIPECVDYEIKELFEIALDQIDKLILRNSSKRDISQRLSVDLNSISATDVSGIASQPSPKQSTYNDKIFDSVEQDPVFPGGHAALLQYVASHIIYPEAAQKNDIQGRVTVQFVVKNDGSIGDVKVVRSKDPDLDKEAVRVIKSLPKFTPGKMNGHPVNCWYTLPITFRLSN